MERTEIQPPDWVNVLGTLWCRYFHTSVMWPIHGEYECRSCGRRHSVPWDARDKMTPQEQASSPGMLKLMLVNSQSSDLRFESRSRHSELPGGTRAA
jgi:hypothetical protein